MDSSNMGMSSGDHSYMPLNDTNVDFANINQAEAFLSAILDDTDYQVIGNAYARYFWYGVVAVVGIAAISNLFQRTTLRMRYVP